MIYLTLLSGLLLSATAAYYSIIGLLAIFPGAVIPITLMGGSLEFAKLIAASWLYRNWSIAPRIIKFYFIFAILILMFITSLGTFGYLSKVHLETGAAVADNSVEITRIESQIQNEERRLNNAQNSISILDNLVQKNKDADQANIIRNRQKVERQNLTNEIKDSSSHLESLRLKVAPLKIANLKTEAEIGPLKYIAEMIYGENAMEHFGSAVRAVIILIVLVFDPLAVLLLIAANISHTNKPIKKKKVDKKVEKGYNRGIKGSIYNFMMRDDFGIQHTDKVKEDESIREIKEK